MFALIRKLNTTLILSDSYMTKNFFSKPEKNDEIVKSYEATITRNTKTTLYYSNDHREPE